MSDSRARAIFFPYLFGDETLRVSLDECVLDGEAIEADWDEDLLECDLSKAEPWTRAKLRFTVERGDRAMWVPELVPSSERTKPPVSLSAALHCSSTLWRWRCDGTLDVKAERGGIEIEFARTDVRGAVDLNIFITRSKPQATEAGLAADAAARILASRPVTLRVDPAARRDGPGLLINWESFQASKHPFRSKHGGALFHLDTAQNPPVLFLNKDAGPDLYAVMSDQAPRGRKAALRNLLFSAIAMPVWDGLVKAAMKAVDPEGHVEKGWERQVLTHVAVAAEPTAEPEEALRRLIGDLKDSSGGRGIDERLPIVISEMIQLRQRAEQSTGALL